MTRPPYNDARRVFLIVDNCSAHRGQRAVERLRQQCPRHLQLQLVRTPTHASWLNQVESYFSIVQRKVHTPNDFRDLDALAERLLDFNTIGNRRRNRSSGRSRGRTLTSFSPSLINPFPMGRSQYDVE
jgi:transposase